MIRDLSELLQIDVEAFSLHIRFSRPWLATRDPEVLIEISPMNHA